VTTTSPRTSPHPAPRISKGLHVGLWLVQGLLGLTFAGTGIWKLVTPIPTLVLPSLTRIKPGLTALAALGCAALQASAVVFHFSRGEGANTPFNFLLVALSLFVAWGRRRPHAARG
jgi:hypothetical protein